jgi:hypothetical protein
VGRRHALRPSGALSPGRRGKAVLARTTRPVTSFRRVISPIFPITSLLCIAPIATARAKMVQMSKRFSNHCELRILGSFRNFEVGHLWRARPRVPRRLSSRRKPEISNNLWKFTGPSLGSFRNFASPPRALGSFRNSLATALQLQSSVYEIPEIALEAEAEDIWARGYGDVLVAAE